MFISRPGKAISRVDYEETHSNPDCEYSPRAIYITAGTMVKVFGRFIRHVDHTGEGQYDLMIYDEIDVCRTSNASITIEPMSSLADTEFCSSQLKSSAPEINSVCDQLKNGPGDIDLSAAYTALGDLYYSGKGVPQSYSEAAIWYRVAADQGNPEAQSKLGHLDYEGLGLYRPLYSEAYIYLSLALKARPNENDAKTEDQAAGNISSVVLKDIQEHNLARWKPSKPAK